MTEFNLGRVVGESGEDGNGIDNIELISTVGLIKTYHINFTDGSYFEYTIRDGADIDLSDYYTKNETNNAINNHHDNTKQDTISDLSTIRNNASLGATALQPNDNVSELTNDVGYLTQHQSLSNYYTKTEIDSVISDKENLSNKVTSISVSSTDTQYPSAKAVYDLFNSIIDFDEELY